MDANPQFHISRQQFDALLASHKAFHEVAIKVTDILKDPSRSAYYRSAPSKVEDDVDMNFIDSRHGVSKGDTLVPKQPSGSTMNHSKRYVPHYQERRPAPDGLQQNLTFPLENMRARKAYYQKRQRSINMYARASVSYVDAEYDFRCTSP